MDSNNAAPYLTKFRNGKNMPTTNILGDEVVDPFLGTHCI